jgi:hypothetical protein
LLEGAAFHKLSGRTCTLQAEYEGDGDKIVALTIIFQGVEAFKCTYHNTIGAELIRLAYDRVVDLGTTQWLKDIQSELLNRPEDVTSLRHLAIYFDDGPCYEFICRSATAEEK